MLRSYPSTISLACCDSPLSLFTIDDIHPSLSRPQFSSNRFFIFKCPRVETAERWGPTENMIKNCAHKNYWSFIKSPNTLFATWCVSGRTLPSEYALLCLIWYIFSFFESWGREKSHFSAHDWRPFSFSVFTAKYRFE